MVINILKRVILWTIRKNVISLDEIKFLQTISEHEGMSLSELANIKGRSLSEVASIVRKMQTMKIEGVNHPLIQVDTVFSEKDRSRNYYLFLTNEGRDTLSKR
jgi:DNA-binding MarR family transcriptional regulator